MSALDDLRAARGLIADPERWTQGVTARDALGVKTDAHFANAARWDALGALIKTTPALMLPGLRFLRESAQELHGCSIAAVNDQHGHDAVLRMYDRAIDLAQVQS